MKYLICFAVMLKGPICKKKIFLSLTPNSSQTNALGWWLRNDFLPCS